MAIPTNIRTLLTGSVVEWARIEFKTTWDPEASLKTITAFANDLDNWGGGYIVIGVKEENGIPVKPYEGVSNDKVDAWQKDIFEKCKLIRRDTYQLSDLTNWMAKILSLSGALVERPGRIRLQRQWLKIIKSAATISGKAL